MFRILVMCPYDWREPGAPRWAHYAHEVFRRIAADGHYVAVITANFPMLARPGRQRLPQIEIQDALQVIHLGNRYSYRFMIGMLLRRMASSSSDLANFDAVFECVSGKPLPLSDLVSAPVIPMVFRLGRGVATSDEPPGPYIAATEIARRQLLDGGVPESFVVGAPFGVDAALYHPCTPEGRMIATAPTRLLYKTLRAWVQEGVSLPPIDCTAPPAHATPRPPRGLPLIFHTGVGDHQRAALYGRADLAYVTEGYEHEALALAASGTPVVCPATPSGLEYVVHGETGFLHRPGDFREAATLLIKLWKDKSLRTEMALNARNRAESMTWNRTASLVLATMENLLARTKA